MLALAALGWLLPRALGRILPRSWRGLCANAALSVVLLLGAGAALFAWLYGSAAGLVWREAPLAFVHLAAKAGLVWGPVAALSLSALPRGWPDGAWALPGAADRDLRGPE